MVVFIPVTTSPPSKSLQVCPGRQGGYHAAHRWEIVIQPIRSVTLLRGTVIHCGAGGPGQALFIPFAPAGYRSRLLTVEPESVTELMNSVPVMPSELLAEGAAVGSPSGTEDSLNFSPLDQGCEELAPAEEAPPTDPVPAPQEEDMADAPADAEPAPPPRSAAQEADPVPAPQEEDMPEAPADAEERPAAPADADAAPPPPHRVRQRRTSSLPTRSPSQSASCRRLRSRWTPQCPTWGTSSSCRRGCVRGCP